jgi:hypothetical protein
VPEIANVCLSDLDLGEGKERTVDTKTFEVPKRTHTKTSLKLLVFVKRASTFVT